MESHLNRIIRHKRGTLEGLDAPPAERLVRSDRDFLAALRGQSRAIIAELKPRSPSEGSLCEHYDPAARARQYQQGGAAALSVLTDGEFFGGQPGHLIEARLASSLPVLRKDFILEEVQVERSRFMGADACLLIVAALKVEDLRRLKARIEELGMAALIEVHNRRELDLAVTHGARLIGINNRNLHDLSVDLQTTPRLCEHVPDDLVVVSESGIATPADLLALPPRVNGVLIGSALMRAADPLAFLRAASTTAEAGA